MKKFSIALILLLCVSANADAGFIYNLIDGASGDQAGHTLSGTIEFSAANGTAATIADFVTATFHVTGPNNFSRTVTSSDSNFTNNSGFIEVNTNEVILNYSALGQLTLGNNVATEGRLRWVSFPGFTQVSQGAAPGGLGVWSNTIAPDSRIVIATAAPSAAVPEPSSFAMFGVAAVSACLLRRRRSSRLAAAHAQSVT